MSKPKLSGRSRGKQQTPLFERQREVEALDAALDRLGEGTGSLLLIEGPAGIGKTRLLAEAVSRAHSRNLLIRAARGGELEREMPFGVVRELLEPVVEHASEQERSALLAGSARLSLVALGWEDRDQRGAGADPAAAIHALYWLLANLSDSQPVVLAIDDVQWADPQTLRFLDYLARRLADIRVLVVATARSASRVNPAS